MADAPKAAKPSAGAKTPAAKPAKGAEAGAEKPAIAGIRKSAILLVALKPELASQVIATMDLQTVEAVTKEIARLKNVSSEEKDSVLEEYFQMNMARKYLEEGGVSYAREILESALPPDRAARILDSVHQTVQTTPFSFLRDAETEGLLTFITDEHPQTIALIMSHLKPEQSAQILSGMTSKKQIEVIKRIANMDHTNPEIIEEVEKSLQKKLASFVTREFEETGGVETVAEILNVADRATEKGLLEALEEEDPDLVEQIRRLMFVFEDLLLVNDKGVQKVLKEVDGEELSKAMKTASEELKDKIFRNMSERAAAMVKEDMEYMGPVRVSEVEQAQQRIVDIVRRLEDQGEIIIQGRGGEEEIIV
ncbi:MAG: flagellar motor switch protein FliG [Planctomycetota bacterium]